MHRLLMIVALCGCSSGSSSISGITPGTVYLGRSQEVLLSGSNTNWSSGTTVDFGPGITVDQLTRSSASALLARITVAGDATPGRRDVRISDGSDYLMTFAVESPIKVSFTGTRAQGSVVRAHIENQDLAHLFDTTSIGDGLFTPQTFPRIVIVAPPGTQTALAGVTPFAIEAQYFVDVTAPAGKLDIDVSSGAPGAALRSLAPGAFELAARTPVALPTGALDGKLAAPFDTALFTVTPEAGARVITLTADDDKPETETVILLLPKSGSFVDNFGGPTARRWLATDGTDPFYAILWDADGGAPSSYTLKRVDTPAARISEAAEPANDFTGAVAIATLPAAVIGASLANANDQDWFSLQVPLGKRVRVVTHGGDPRTDTVVALYAADGTTLIGAELDNNFQETYVSPPVMTAGTYYIKISASSLFLSSHSTYNAAIVIE